MESGSSALVALVLAVSVVAADGASAAQEPPPRIDGVAALAGDTLERPVEAALGWTKFIAAGYRDAGDHVGNGDAPDAELALGSAMETSVKTLVEGLPGKKGKVRLNEAVEGTITKVDETGFVVTVGKAEQTVAWPDVDPTRLAIQLIRNKPTAEGDLATLAVLKLLGGDAAEARKQSGKLTGELGGKLKELLEAWQAIAPELAAARALDSILRERDAEKAVARFKAEWPAIAATQLGKEVTAKAREQFVLRAKKAVQGEAALKAAIHGTVRMNPSKAHPGAGPGGVGLEIEYEFESDAEGGDFEPLEVPAPAGGRAAPRRADAKMAPFLIDQSRALGGESACGGALPIEFGGDVELEMQGGIPEGSRGGDMGLVRCGFATAGGDQQIVLDNFYALTVFTDGKRGASLDKELGELRTSMVFSVKLELKGGKLIFTRNGEEASPRLNVTPKGTLRPLLLMSPQPQWFVERLVVRGTATRASLESLGTLVAEREAQALFGS